MSASKLADIIEIFLNESYDGIYFEEIHEIIQKKIYYEMLMTGELLIKDDKLCLKSKCYIFGNKKFYLFEEGYALVGTEIKKYDFIKVDFKNHKDYNKISNKLNTKISKTVNTNEINIDEFKLFMLNNPSCYVAKMQYLCYTNKELPKLEQDYNLFFSHVYESFAINKNEQNIDIIKYAKDDLHFTKIESCNDICTKFFIFEDVLNLNKYNYSFYPLTLTSIWEKTFCETTLNCFAKFTTIEEIMDWLKITKFDKIQIRRKFVKEKLNDNLYKDMYHVILDTNSLGGTNLKLFLAQYQDLHKYFTNNQFVNKLGKVLNII